MSCDEVFVEYLLELMSPLGEVTTNRMFGGVGFVKDGMMFALVADSTLYLKADDDNRAEFEARELEPFIYEKTNKHVTMSYYQAPEESLDDSEAMHAWAESGLDAARRAQQKKMRKKNSQSIVSDTARLRDRRDAEFDALTARDLGEDGDDLSLDGEYA